VSDTSEAPGTFRASDNLGLRIEGERIVELGPDLAPAAGEQIVDAAGLSVVPGFVDVHAHAGAGFDTMDATPEALGAMARFYAEHGVTSFLATTMASPQDALMAAMENAAAYQRGEQTGARVIGVHLEGPYINSAAKGAQPESSCRLPDWNEIEALMAAGPLRLITLAPELPGAEAVVRATAAKGITAAIGHTTASYEQAVAATGWGARHATHTFNAMVGLHHRKPGTVGAVLSDPRLVAEVIADGIHLHPAIVALVVRTKGPGRVTLVTDAMRAAGLPDGMYELGGQPVVVDKGACWLADAEGKATATLAGSTLTLDTALRNTMAWAGLSLSEALPMVTSTPAAQAGMAGEIGALAPGLLADVVFLDKDNRVVTTIVGGKRVYSTHNTA
jgi:N-acetylglucosamine-6-phosphate deacetylase